MTCFLQSPSVPDPSPRLAVLSPLVSPKRRRLAVERTRRIARRLLSACGVATLGAALAAGSPAFADDPYLPIVPVGPGNGGFDDTGTVPGNIIESKGDLIRDRGKSLYFQSLSARQYQAAIDRALDNRREAIESYYDMRTLRDAYVKSNRLRVTDELAREIAERGAPDRLTSTFLNSETGELRWPEPLDAEALEPYRKPIEEAFAKRSSPGSPYTLLDHLKVHRMVDLMQEALEMIKDGLPVREYIALDDYLTQISFESRFDASGNRVDLSSSLASKKSTTAGRASQSPTDTDGPSQAARNQQDTAETSPQQAESVDIEDVPAEPSPATD